jgi:hypothetical protein
LIGALPPLERERGVRTGESWSVVEDRIDGWWEADSPAGFKERSLGQTPQRNPG